VERLWAPWREAYVSATSRPSGCVLCQARDGAEEAEPLVIHRSEQCLVLMNLYPYKGGHVMVAPLRHIGTLADASVEELADMMALARRLEAALHEAYHPDGLNVGMNLGRPAGAGIADHIHLHVVPRWNGDTSFMTVVGETRVISEEPTAACARLRPFFEGR
jgi:ATP adenylyltransferase